MKCPACGSSLWRKLWGKMGICISCGQHHQKDELAEYQEELEKLDDSWFGNEDLDTNWDYGLLDEEFDDE